MVMVRQVRGKVSLCRAKKGSHRAGQASPELNRLLSG